MNSPYWVFWIPVLGVAFAMWVSRTVRSSTRQRWVGYAVGVMILGAVVMMFVGGAAKYP